MSEPYPTVNPAAYARCHDRLVGNPRVSAAAEELGKKRSKVQLLCGELFSVREDFFRLDERDTKTGLVRGISIS